MVLSGDQRLRAVQDRLGEGLLFCGKGPGVPVPHDLVAGAGDGAVRPVVHSVGGRVVDVHHRALGAEDLHPLVVAVHRPAAVVDDAHGAVGELQRHHGGVHIPGLADGRIHQHGAVGEDLRHLGPGQEAGHVKVVDVLSVQGKSL